VLVCEVHDEQPAGDHTVVLGRVRTVRTLGDGTGLDTVSLRIRARHSDDQHSFHEARPRVAARPDRVDAPFPVVSDGHTPAPFLGVR
jgi:flavin reductase (DIM6/NTAB) family NADH-FMN oxidoreductase RutF